MELYKMLTISTAHLSQETAKQLDDGVDLGVTVYPKAEYGWFVVVPSSVRDLEDSECPADLYKCLHFAAEHGARWLCIDCDVEETSDLPVYDW